MKTCASCGGNGECSHCKGKGKKISLISDYTCLRCNGSGVCPACKGSGKV